MASSSIRTRLKLAFLCKSSRNRYRSIGTPYYTHHAYIKKSTSMELQSGMNGWHPPIEAILFTPNTKMEIGKKDQKKWLKDVLKQNMKKNATSILAAENPVQRAGISWDPLPKTEQQCSNPKDQSNTRKKGRRRKERKQQPNPNPPAGTICPQCRKIFKQKSH